MKLAPLPKGEMRLITREELPTLRSVVQDGVEHSLGQLKDFRKHPLVAAFIPESARLSLAWVHLENGQSLATHIHPTKSFIVVAKGTGKANGAAEFTFKEGDLVLVDSDTYHGFTGGPEGFWALSIQFEGHGLYENSNKARVSFEVAKDPLAVLLEKNRIYREAYKNNLIFNFVTGDAVNDPIQRGRLLDTIQVWSNFFQRAVLARSAFCEDPRYSGIFQDHLKEEFGHNENLASDRGEGLLKVWDPILEATSSWFAWKMLTLDNAEKLVLVHLVLEAAATVFHIVAHPIMSKFRETDHFATHHDGDQIHETMGISLLTNLDPHSLTRLETVQKQGWDMMNTLCARMAEIAVTSDQTKGNYL